MTENGPITAYHAKYFAHELTRRASSDSVEKLVGALADAQVDLNPHQIEAALFAFRSPLSRGAILADEVGLGKTIEAGLLLAQRWAERKRRILVIVPANLRQQWTQELADKFFLPSLILETRSFNAEINRGNLNPFQRPEQQAEIVVCSYQFVKTKAPYVKQVAWDLVVIDEAHRLRNVYKPTNRIANAIKDAVAAFPKILLTATPLQNSLLELYGLVSLIDDYAFGDIASFKAQFSRLNGHDEFADLKDRLRPVCKRTLRKQVLEYVKYTNRHAIVQEFYPSAEEQRLYDLVTDYLQSDTLYALPNKQRKLMTLIMRKLLASSTYAIAGTLAGLADKLEAAAKSAEAVEQAPDEVAENYEDYDELADEWEEDEDAESEPAQKNFNPHELAELRQERARLREFHQLAQSIVKNSKGEVLLTALRRGFEASAKAQTGQQAALQQKAIIFTESRRTQDYLRDVLEQTEFAGKIVLFNGSNTDAKSNEIYQRWLVRHKGTDHVTGSPTADKRAALVEYFREEAVIMIATEAAAEGINLQFCNLVVNYDLPWNPQRIEQRIGRCHRYGQQFDVVVVNFLNKKNEADQRVYELLDEKFRLFNGVFGASDEVLGAVESGVDFEKRIAGIYQQCRTPQQIEFEFDKLQQDLEQEVGDARRDAREKLLNNFDQEVIEKVRIESGKHLGKLAERLWALTRHALRDDATFNDEDRSFTLRRNPFPGAEIHRGAYRMGRNVEDANTYRIGHPLAQHVIAQCKSATLANAKLVFDYSGSGKNLAALAPLVGKSGWLRCVQCSISAFETEDHVLFAAVTDDGEALDAVQCSRLFDLPAQSSDAVAIVPETRDALEKSLYSRQQGIIEALGAKNGNWFDIEMDKLDKWAEDRRAGLRMSLKELDDEIGETKKRIRQAADLPEKLVQQRKVRTLEQKRDEAWRAYDEAAKDVNKKKEELIEAVEAKLKQHITVDEIFTIQWSIA